jgi:hypothetical protein
MCGVKTSVEYDSNRPLSDENIGKVSIKIKDGVRFVLNQSQLKLIFP